MRVLKKCITASVADSHPEGRFQRLSGWYFHGVENDRRNLLTR